MLYCCLQNTESGLSASTIEEAIVTMIEKIPGNKRILIIPPDYSRRYSYAGEITRFIYKHFPEKVKAILPALGTHFPMTSHEINTMYKDIPPTLFKIHNWRKDLVTLGMVPSDFVTVASENKVKYDWPAQVNKLIIEGNFDLIISIGQVVPHEVAGMANYNKNIFIGTGGKEGINKSHFLGATFGLERIMGKIKNPVREVFDYASQNFGNHLPFLYIQTVLGKTKTGELSVKGVFAGDDRVCFERAAELSVQENFTTLNKPLQKVIVYLNPNEYKSTWLGNKAIYRTRMAIGDGGELIIIAPGIQYFGEDKTIDAAIRRYGYSGTEFILKQTNKSDELQNNLSAAAHLIHGSSENRFNITYATGKISKEEIESVNYSYADLTTAISTYSLEDLNEGYNLVNGEEIYFISNPALGLWKTKKTEYIYGD